MNRLEKFIYDCVKENPGLKRGLVDFYQKLLLFVPKEKKKTEYNIIEREGYFFGFHDKIPWSNDNNKLLAHKYNIPNRDIRKNDEVEIGYFYGEDNKKFEPLAKTKAWNWQQGSMLQWLGANDGIIFNIWNGEDNVARIIDIEGEIIKDLPSAIGATAPNGDYALSYSFERLNRGMYGYGYPHENDEFKNQKAPNQSGLSVINIKSKREKLLFTIRELKNIQQDETMKNSYHFFTHCLFSPNGKRFLFLHRWKRKGKRKYSRLISCDLDGNHMHIFPTDGMVSHFTWVGDDKVLAYCNTEKYGDGYHLLEDQTNHYELIGENKYTQDGHPQYCDKNKSIVTDSYPNRFRIQELSIFDLEKREKNVVGKFYSPNQFKESIRCDLHPRWDRTGTKICFDSAYTGKRSLCTLDLTNKT